MKTTTSKKKRKEISKPPLPQAKTHEFEADPQTPSQGRGWNEFDAGLIAFGDPAKIH
jgi:hypothetical protein